MAFPSFDSERGAVEPLVPPITHTPGCLVHRAVDGFDYFLSFDGDEYIVTLDFYRSNGDMVKRDYKFPKYQEANSFFNRISSPDF